MSVGDFALIAAFFFQDKGRKRSPGFTGGNRSHRTLLAHDPFGPLIRDAGHFLIREAADLDPKRDLFAAFGNKKIVVIYGGFVLPFVGLLTGGAGQRHDSAALCLNVLSGDLFRRLDAVV